MSNLNLIEWRLKVASLEKGTGANGLVLRENDNRPFGYTRFSGPELD